MIEVIDWLTANTMSWALEVNPERTVYLSRDDYLTEQRAMGCVVVGDVLPGGPLYEARAYPSTPVGYVVVMAPTAVEALTGLRQVVES